MPEGTLRFINQFVTLTPTGTPGATAVARYSIPSGGVARLKSIRFTDDLDDGMTDVIAVKIIRRGHGQSIDLLSGTPNLREYAGIGKLPKVPPIVEGADQDTDFEVTLLNRDTAIHKISLTHEFEMVRVPFIDNVREDPVERLLIANRTIVLPPQQEQRFVYSAPKGYDAKPVEVTAHWSIESEEVTIKDIILVRPGDSEGIGLLDGTMDIRELAGDGQLAGVFTTVNKLRSREDMVIVVRNDEPLAPVRVQLTMWLVLVPAESD
jgi:hypothetical protein